MLQLSSTGCDEPAAVLSGQSHEGRFRYWRGSSGRRYLHTVHALADWPGYERANVLFVRRRGGRRDVVAVARLASQARADALLARMAAEGANEVHVHLLAGSARARRAVAEDLAAAFGLSAG